ncbi:MAG: hypothetical protein M1541_16700, partial [Acidobacteria bacterium]|nr:hypothetical protein [Acidobacteriota bacterium]
GADAVYYQLLGTAPNRQFVVQWNVALPLNSSSGVTFQAVFYEGTNNIAFQYLSVAASSNGKIATVGIRDAGGHLNVRRLQWSYDAAVLKDAMALVSQPAGIPVP